MVGNSSNLKLFYSERGINYEKGSIKCGFILSILFHLFIFIHVFYTVPEDLKRNKIP